MCASKPIAYQYPSAIHQPSPIDEKVNPMSSAVQTGITTAASSISLGHAVRLLYRTALPLLRSTKKTCLLMPLLIDTHPLLFPRNIQYVIWMCMFHIMFTNVFGFVYKCRGDRSIMRLSKYLNDLSDVVKFYQESDNTQQDSSYIHLSPYFAIVELSARMLPQSVLRDEALLKRLYLLSKPFFIFLEDVLFSPVLGIHRPQSLFRLVNILKYTNPSLVEVCICMCVRMYVLCVHHLFHMYICVLTTQWCMVLIDSALHTRER